MNNLMIVRLSNFHFNSKNRINTSKWYQRLWLITNVTTSDQEYNGVEWYISVIIAVKIIEESFKLACTIC